ncbi:MAG: phosphoethanolamine transferase domain-containing protein [Symbiopectobacterium sp.]
METNVLGSVDLFTLKLAFWVLLVGVFCQVRIVGKNKTDGIKPRSVSVSVFDYHTISLLIILLVAALSYKDYASLMRNNTEGVGEIYCLSNVIDRRLFPYVLSIGRPG